MQTLSRHHYVAASLATVIATLYFYCAALSQTQQIITLFLFAGLIGVPHGLTDWALLPGLGRRAGFSGGKNFRYLVGASIYLFLTGVFMLVWKIAPLVALITFLTISMIHFGREDVNSHLVIRRPLLNALLRGFGLILVIYCAHADTAAYFNLLIGTNLFSAANSGTFGICLMIGAFTLTSCDAGRVLYVIETLGLLTMAALLPPLLAFTLYFCLWHTPRHYIEVWGRQSNHSRSRSLRAFLFLVIGFLIICSSLILCLFNRVPATHNLQLLVAFFQILAALTFAHVIANQLSKNPSLPHA